MMDSKAARYPFAVAWQRRYRLRMGFLVVIALLAGTVWTLWRAPALARVGSENRSPTLVGLAILFAGAGAYLVYYAASEDSYRRGGISRWEAYDVHALTLGAIGACLAVCAIAFTADRQRGRLVWLTAPGGLAAALLFATAVAANSLN